MHQCLRQLDHRQGALQEVRGASERLENRFHPIGRGVRKRGALRPIAGLFRPRPIPPCAFRSNAKRGVTSGSSGPHHAPMTGELGMMLM